MLFHRSSNHICNRGEIRLEVYIPKSSLYPERWQLIKRFRFLLLAHRVKADRRKLSPETQKKLVEAERALEYEFLYGKGRTILP